MSAIVYRNGTVVSAPELGNYRPSVTSYPSPKCFGLSFKTKMKIYDAAHIQAMELSNSGFEYHRKKTKINHVFLTPTFDENNIDSYSGSNANDAISRFCENLKSTYGATSYLWVKEFTKHLTPHYHMLVTIPYTAIGDLNRAWSHARGDISTVRNALRTGWNKKYNRPEMRVRNFKSAVGYAAKYIAKADGGDICVMKSSVKLSSRQTWEYRSGHSTKAYGVSYNLLREPKSIDWDLWRHLNPRSRSAIVYRNGTVVSVPELGTVKEVKTEFSDLFFHDNPIDAQRIYRKADSTIYVKPQKTEKIELKKSNYNPFDQLKMQFSRSIR